MDRKIIKLHPIYEFIKWYLASAYVVRLRQACRQAQGH